MAISPSPPVYQNDQPQKRSLQWVRSRWQQYLPPASAQWVYLPQRSGFGNGHVCGRMRLPMPAIGMMIHNVKCAAKIQKCIFRLVVARLFDHFPVLPNPPAPRSVSSRSSVSARICGHTEHKPVVQCASWLDGEGLFAEVHHDDLDLATVICITGSGLFSMVIPCLMARPLRDAPATSRNPQVKKDVYSGRYELTFQ